MLLRSRSASLSETAQKIRDREITAQQTLAQIDQRNHALNCFTSVTRENEL